MDRYRATHLALTAIVLVSGSVIVFDYTTSIADGNDVAAAGDSQIGELLIKTNSTYRPKNLTVVTSVSGAISSAKEDGALFVVAPNGSIVYQEHRYNIYDDADPSPRGKYTLTYVAAEKLTGAECSGVGTSPCTRNFIERLNFSTGYRERLYSMKTPRVVDSRWHDADRLNATHFAIADISNERLIVVNIRTNTITYEWRMASAFSKNRSGATDEPHDWAHLNDVEYIEGGTFMLSPRNHDQVVFVRPGQGIIENRTLGSDNNYGTLYEQHNPDYLTGPNGTESVLIADSQNNRIVEYERRGDEWVETWSWSRSEFRWPRDADRLPNGNTLVSFTSSDRIVEISPKGEVVWGVRVKGNYEAERLGTGDESMGGNPMTVVKHSNSLSEDIGSSNVIPPKLRLAVNGILFVSPGWVEFRTVVAGFLSLLGILGFGVTVVKSRLS